MFLHVSLYNIMEEVTIMHDHSLHFHSQEKTVPYNVTSDKMMLKNSNEAEHLHRMPVLESCFKSKVQKRNSVQGPILASSGGNYPPSRDKIAVEGSLQTLCRPVPHPDSDNHTQPQSIKTPIGCSTVQLPQSLLNELSSVLSQTGRIPRQENWELTKKKKKIQG